MFNNKNEENIGNDVLLSLYRYYSRHITWNEEKFGESYWTRIKRLFNKICYPAELVRFESGPDSDTLIFRKNELEYDLYQMSSGEHQVFRILVGLTSARAKKAIDLIDEIVLNLHPTWQKRLIRALRDDTDNNQYIFTTHSPDVIGLFY
ncbi:MAG: AAA family ATPase, partial [Pseudanabaena sp.]